jgi:hypothetical protein
VDRLLIVVVLVIVAVAAALVVQRMRPRPAPTTTVRRPLPDRLDRGDFDRPGAPWLVAVFTSTTCAACAGVWDRAQPLASDEVAVAEIEYGAARGVHERYGIDAVPAVLIADAEGRVRATFVGPVTATDLWASVAEVRAPGTLPADGCNHGVDEPADAPVD